MKHLRRFMSPVLLTALALGGVACDDDGPGDKEDDDGGCEQSQEGGSDGGEAPEPAVDQCAALMGDQVEIATAKLYIEYNFTDGDLGVHGLFDDTGWTVLCVYDPAGEPVLAVEPVGALGDLTMAGFFFESREPELGEFGFPELEAGFAEGQYEVRARAFDGTIYSGAATFTRDVPLPPTVVAPPIVEDEEDAGDAVVPTEALVVQWEPVTETVGGDPAEITGYEVIVTNEDSEDPNGFARPLYDVHMPASATSLAVPSEFLEADTLYELEILALEVSGNQTISVGFFRTE